MFLSLYSPLLCGSLVFLVFLDFQLFFVAMRVFFEAFPTLRFTVARKLFHGSKFGNLSGLPILFSLFRGNCLFVFLMFSVLKGILSHVFLGCFVVVILFKLETWKSPLALPSPLLYISNYQVLQNLSLSNLLFCYYLYSGS